MVYHVILPDPLISSPYLPSDISSMITPRGIRWVGNMACIWEVRNAS